MTRPKSPYIGIVMPFSTCLALAPSDESRKKMRLEAEILADSVQRGDLICFGGRLGDWPVVRTPECQHYFLQAGDRVLDSSGVLQYRLDDVGPSYAPTRSGHSEHRGVLLRHSFYHLAGEGALDSDGWCSWTRTGWPHEPVFAAQASEALRCALRKDTKITIPDPSLKLG